MTAQTPEVQIAVAKLNALGKDVKSGLIERDEVVDLIITALVAEQHLLMVGPPGVAKSKVAGDVFARIGGAAANFFALTKGSTPDMIVGPMSIIEIKERGRFKHETANMLPESDIVFIDEVFKGNTLTMNATLNVLADRVFMNGGVLQRCPLVSAVTASNEFPDSRDLSAFYDRLLVRVEVNPISDHAKRMRMTRMGATRRTGYAEATKMIDIADIRLLNEARREIVIPDAIDEVAADLYNALAGLGSEADLGDRRWQLTFNLAAARALLAGRNEIAPQDLLVFAHTAWGVPESRRTVQSAVNRAISPEMADVIDIYDAIEDGHQQFLRQCAEVKDNPNFTNLRLTLNMEFASMADSQSRQMEARIGDMDRKGMDTTQAKEYLAKVKRRLHEAMTLSIS